MTVPERLLKAAEKAIFQEDEFMRVRTSDAEHLARIALAAADLLRAEDDEDAPLSITEFHDAIDRATVARAALRKLLGEMNRGQ